MPRTTADGVHLDRDEILAATTRVREAMASRPYVPFTMMQAAMDRDAPAKGSVHIARARAEASNVDTTAMVRAFESAIQHLADGRPTRYDPITVLDVEVEWIAHRPGVDKDAPEIPGSPKEQYEAMMRNVSSDTVVLFTGGIAGLVNRLAANRPFLAAIAQQTGGRCLAVKRRMGPQHSFPAPLVDLLVAYMSLLRPGPAALHSPVHPSNIVFCGISQGGSSLLGLTQVLLHLYHTARPALSIPLPAGNLALSLAPEIHPNLPSWWADSSNDSFPMDSTLGPQLDFPSCPAWPSNPVREHPLSYKEMLSHPLLAPSISKSWTGAPPLYMDIGNTERYIDGARLLASNVTKSGAVAILDEFEFMPHDFPFFFPHLWQSRRLILRAGEMARRFVAVAHGRGEPVSSQRWLWTVDGEQRPLNLAGMHVLDTDEARALLAERADALPPWTGPTAGDPEAKL